MRCLEPRKNDILQRKNANISASVGERRSKQKESIKLYVGQH
jgi:hypothetical protein